MPAPPLDEALRSLAAEYAAAGLRVATDPQNINPPCVYVALDQKDPAALSGDAYTAQWSVLLIAPNSGQLAALRALSELEAVAVTVAPPLGPTTAEEFSLPDGAAPLPCLLMTVTTRVTPD